MQNCRVRIREQVFLSEDSSSDKSVPERTTEDESQNCLHDIVRHCLCQQFPQHVVFTNILHCEYPGSVKRPTQVPIPWLTIGVHKRQFGGLQTGGIVLKQVGEVVLISWRDGDMEVLILGCPQRLESLPDGCKL